MEQLIQLLSNIVSAEYAQWLRYTYLSSLSYGFDTDQLADHFEEHANEELEHAKLISRWLTDFGGLPPTELPPVEQYVGSAQGAVEWLINYEIEGIEKYNIAYALANELCATGLQHDIGVLLSVEHEHLSDLTNLISPHLLSDDKVTMVMIAYKFNKFASQVPNLFKELIINRFVSLGKTAGAEPSSIDDYLAEMIELGRYNVLQTESGEVQLSQSDIETLQTTLPELVREWVVKDIENAVKILWDRRETEDITAPMEFYKEVYEWIRSPEVAERWLQLFNKYSPDWQSWLQSDWYEETPPQEFSVEDILQQISPEEAPVREPPVEEEVRRPVEEKVEEKIKILHPTKKTRTFEVGVGDEIFNQDARDAFRENSEDFGLTKDEINKYSIGTIKEIRPDGSLLVSVKAEGQFAEQIWGQDQRLWGSRESGQRVVN